MSVQKVIATHSERQNGFIKTALVFFFKQSFFIKQSLLSGFTGLFRDGCMLRAAYLRVTMRQLKVGTPGSILGACSDFDSVTAGFSVSISLCNCLGQFFFSSLRNI